MITPPPTSFCTPEEKPTMSIPNRLTLDAVPLTPIGEIAALPARNCTAAAGVAETLAEGEASQDWWLAASNLKYRNNAAACVAVQARYRKVRIEDGMGRH